MSQSHAPSPDAFQDSVQHLAQVAAKQKKLVIVAGVIALASVLAFSIYANQRTSRQRAAYDALFKAKSLLADEMDALNKVLNPQPATDAKTEAKDAKKGVKKAPPPAAQKNVEFERFDVPSKLGAAVREFESVAMSFPGTKAAYDAQMTLGNLYYQHGGSADFPTAAKWFAAAASGATKNEDSIAAYYSLGYAHEANGACEEAVKAYDRALNFGESPFGADVLKSQARCYEMLKNVDKAKGAYTQLTQKYPQSEAARFAEARLRKL